MELNRREFLQGAGSTSVGLVSLATLFGYISKAFAFVKDEEVIEKEGNGLTRERMGKNGGDLITLCKMSGDSSICVGPSCSMYQNCWEYLNPDKDGFFYAKMVERST
jgi:hypothetical protein